MKICSNNSCILSGAEQPIENFSQAKHHSDGLSSRCKTCINSYHRRRKTLKQAYDLQYRRLNADKIKKNKHLQHLMNADKINARSSKWIQDHRPHVNKRNRLRRLTDMQYKLACHLRWRLNSAIKNKQKGGSAVGDLGCSIAELKIHLESQFKPGMSWKNWSKTGWHIDHIMPVSKFDLTNRNEFLKAVHYSNLQPLWAKENLAKSNRTK